MSEKLSGEVLRSVDEGGDYWDGDIDDTVILRWGKGIATLEAKLEAARHLLASAPKGFVPLSSWSQAVDEWLKLAAAQTTSGGALQITAARVAQQEEQ